MTASLLLTAAFALTQVNAYQYDEMVRLISERSGHEERLIAAYAYDAEGRMTSVTDRAGATMAMTYDQHGRVNMMAERQFLARVTCGQLPRQEEVLMASLHDGRVLVDRSAYYTWILAP